MGRLQIEAFLDFGEGGVEEMGHGNEEDEKSHLEASWTTFLWFRSVQQDHTPPLRIIPQDLEYFVPIALTPMGHTLLRLRHYTKCTLLSVASRSLDLLLLHNSTRQICDVAVALIS